MVSALTALILMSQQQFRPPAIPLVTHDPYFSVWSFGDKLTDDWTKHWTGKNQALCGMVRVDGKPFKWLSRGIDKIPTVDQSPAVVETQQTKVAFSAGGVNFLVRFVGNSDISSVDALTQPYTTIVLESKSADGNDHKVEWYFDVSAELATDSDTQEVGWSRFRIGGQEAICIGTKDQKPLSRPGDDLRIDWGQAFLMSAMGGEMIVGSSESIRRRFANTGGVGDTDDVRQPRAVSDEWPVMAWTAKTNASSAGTTGYVGVILAYNDDPCIELFQRQLSPVWKSHGHTFSDILVAAKQNFDDVAHETSNEVSKQWSERYGENFANLATIAYRQSIAGHKTVEDVDGTLMMFPKENFSNGCISTVDVIYPACPIFLANNPSLLKANLEPVMQYASMKRWKWKFAPHDLGTYPKANGQVYGGGERTEEDQMPVEESGNMLIMAAAYLEKSGDKEFIGKYWAKWTEWAEFLKDFGLDPGKQLCTDDFAGHLAHNSNLSVKAIVAMACYGRMCETMGHHDDAVKWSKLSKTYVDNWLKMADDGDHYRLAFDKPGTWSQKYNLVWDKVLKLGLFPQSVYDKEVAWYLKHQNKYGLPLDNRADYTKLDWTVWTACLTSNKADFEAIMAPVYKWMNETTDRIPLTDWFDTKTGKCIGFRARTVVGGVFMPMLLKK